MRYRFAALLLASAAVCVAPARTPVTAQTAATQQKTQQKLPPLSYVCPMIQDAEVLEDKAGNCPKCGMKLEPVRLDSKYSCLTHPAVVQDGPGKCPIDKSDLVQVTLSVFWTCPGDDKHLLEPGACANGQPRKMQYEPRPHGDHNPRHGGQFFMASDTWHHIEGTYPRPGLFRMYFYNDYTKPLPARGFTGEILVLDANDKELLSVPLKQGRISNTLEAPLPAAKLPLKAAAKIKFKPTDKDNRFDFTFTEVSKEPATPVPTTTRTAPATGMPARAPAAASAVPAPAGTPSGPATQSTAPTPTPPVSNLAMPDLSQAPVALAGALDEASLPNDVPALLAELTKRSLEVDALIKDGNLSSVWLPAMGTKTVALALEAHNTRLSEPQRVAASAAMKRVVVAAWQIDAYGDLGNKQKISQAYDQLAAAVTDLKTAYAGPR
jgi:hypothetical protein